MFHISGARHHGGAAFQVTLVTEEPLEARRLDILKYDKETTNIGQHYDMSTGEFTAPRTGTYVFNLQVVASDGTYVEVSIEKIIGYNHYEKVMTAISDKMGPDKTTGGQGNASGVLMLRKGQKVTTKVTWISGEKKIEGRSKTSFSGYFLYPCKRWNYF